MDVAYILGSALATSAARDVPGIFRRSASTRIRRIHCATIVPRNEGLLSC